MEKGEVDRVERNIGKGGMDKKDGKGQKRREKVNGERKGGVRGGEGLI
jgi:hypothetical protein